MITRLKAVLAAFLIIYLALPATAQEADALEGARIVSAQIAGLESDQLSAELRQQVSELVGKPLNSSELAELGARIERERPGVIAAVRTVRTPDGEAKVVIFVARISGDPQLEENINARYTIESVEVDGVPETDVSQELRNELQTLVGLGINHELLDRFAGRLRDELPNYDVNRKMTRGSRRGQLRLIYEIRRNEANRPIHFAPARSKLLYHSEQGWSGLLDLRIGGRDVRVAPIFALANSDNLVEEYSGFGLRVESRKVGSEHLGLSLQLSTFDQQWEDSTLAALAANPAIPEAYRNRSTIEPLVTVGFTPYLQVSGGISVSELESLSRSPQSQMANALVLSVAYDQTWRDEHLRQTLQAAGSVRSAATTLESDLDYNRYFVTANHRSTWGRNTAIASIVAGRITGQAPLFERFTLGDSTTLRGWDKYDIAPAGGDRVLHASLEYRNRGLAFFFDAGSVWDDRTSSRTRTSVGFGFHGDNVFLTFGFPLNTDDVNVGVMVGVRF